MIDPNSEKPSSIVVKMQIKGHKYIPPNEVNRSHNNSPQVILIIG